MLSEISWPRQHNFLGIPKTHQTNLPSTPLHLYIYIYTVCICIWFFQNNSIRSSPILRLLRFLANSVGALHYLVEMKTDIQPHQVSSCNSECMEFISVASRNAVPFLGDKHIGAIAPEQAPYEVKKVFQAVYSSRQKTSIKLQTHEKIGQSIYS